MNAAEQQDCSDCSGAKSEAALQPEASPTSKCDEAAAFVAWYDELEPTLPALVKAQLRPLRDFLAANPDPAMYTRSRTAKLLRAMGLLASSEKRSSGRPLDGLPKEPWKSARNRRTTIQEKLERSKRLSVWHGELQERHVVNCERLRTLREQLRGQPDRNSPDSGQDMPGEDKEGMAMDTPEDTPVDQIELTDEQRAKAQAEAQLFVDHLSLGDGIDKALEPVHETLMPTGAVLHAEQKISLSAQVPDELADAQVVKTLHDVRERYDFSMTVTRIELDVEKKVVVTKDGERRVLAASTSEFGPPRFTVTWSALATLAVMVGQFAVPLNRLAKMLSVAGKLFTAATLGRMVHYVARRLVPVYLQLKDELADSEILAGDDTSCRVLEVSRYFKQLGESTEPPNKRGKSKKPKAPWRHFDTPELAEASYKRCLDRRKARIERREQGDRKAIRTQDEEPSLGVLIGRELQFEHPLKNRDGSKRSFNTSVLTGRSVAEDPRSLIVLYRSHLGAVGNLLTSLLCIRNPLARDVLVQTDLSTTNLVTSPEVASRFNIRLAGCSAHARRDFAVYEHEDPAHCGFMLHMFKGLALHEQRLDVHGRNYDNVLAVRGSESRALWQQIKALAETMSEKWSKGTKLGRAARYILNHFAQLTIYLNDARLAATNNLRERLLRMEKLIQKGSLFRVSLEGRFALDIIRTILQTAVAADAPVHAYLMAVLRADPEEVATHPERFTPYAWMSQAHTAAETPDQAHVPKPDSTR
jgi:hypothetical protein